MLVLGLWYHLFPASCMTLPCSQWGATFDHCQGISSDVRLFCSTCSSGIVVWECLARIMACYTKKWSSTWTAISCTCLTCFLGWSWGAPNQLCRMITRPWVDFAFANKVPCDRFCWCEKRLPLLCLLLSCLPISLVLHPLWVEIELVSHGICIPLVTTAIANVLQILHLLK